MRHTLHVTVDSPDDLAAVVDAVEALGHRVECPVFDAWSRLRARDELLRAAHGLMSGASSWARCLRLSEEIERFERRWPALREHETLPEGCSALRSCLFRARRLGALPTSPRQLQTIVSLKRAGAGHFSSERD